MFPGILLSPGVALMRRMPFAGKLMLLAAVSAISSLPAGYRLITGDSLGTSPANLMIANGIGLSLSIYFLLALYQSVSQGLGRLILTIDSRVSGRGFAVVASEICLLSQRSAASAKEIRQLIDRSSSHMASSVLKIREAGSNIEAIVTGIRHVATDRSLVTASSNQQSVGLTEITTAIRQLDEITQRNATMAASTVTHAVNLEGRATTLVECVALFRLQQGSAEEALQMVAQEVSHRSQTSRGSFSTRPDQSGQRIS